LGPVPPEIDSPLTAAMSDRIDGRWQPLAAGITAVAPAGAFAHSQLSDAGREITS
jgi:hypothetical protein